MSFNLNFYLSICLSCYHCWFGSFNQLCKHERFFLSVVSFPLLVPWSLLRTNFLHPSVFYILVFVSNAHTTEPRDPKSRKNPIHRPRAPFQKRELICRTSSHYPVLANDAMAKGTDFASATVILEKFVILELEYRCIPLFFFSFVLC